MPVHVRSDGCVRLGPTVSVDGFAEDAAVRIQTHVHEDHMVDFNRSKGIQKKIITSAATLDLLIAELNADLPHRSPHQLLAVPEDGSEHVIEGAKIRLYPSGHMLGGTMASVELPRGRRVLYTSDFNWPLSIVPEGIDTLIVDSTYGEPAQVRNYEEKQVTENLISLVDELWKQGPILIKGYRGRLQHVMAILANTMNVPLVLSRCACAYSVAPVYAKYNRVKINPIEIGSPEFQKLIRAREKFIGFVDLRDQAEANSRITETSILLSSYMVPKQDPIIHHSSNFYRVALTDHADFNGTIKLIDKIRPRQVIADNARRGHAHSLVRYVSDVLKIPATAEVSPKPLGW
jgi:Cft2 family RNA processing exonuclease